MSHDTQPAKDQAPHVPPAVSDAINEIIGELFGLFYRHTPAEIVRVLAEAGYKIVPVEATEAMLRQGSAALYPPSRDFADECWRAMVRAAGDEGVART